MAIPAKKALSPFLGYLSEQELGHLLAQIDRLAKRGERDYVFLSLLYDTGARIQELLDLTPRDSVFAARDVESAHVLCCLSPLGSCGSFCALRGVN